MCLLSTIKTAQQASSSSRIYKHKAMTRHLTGEDLQSVDFTAYNNQLTYQQWITFQLSEKCWTQRNCRRNISSPVHRIQLSGLN